MGEFWRRAAFVLGVGLTAVGLTIVVSTRTKVLEAPPRRWFSIVTPGGERRVCGYWVERYWADGAKSDCVKVYDHDRTPVADVCGMPPPVVYADGLCRLEDVK